MEYDTEMWNSLEDFKEYERKEKARFNKLCDERYGNGWNK